MADSPSSGIMRPKRAWWSQPQSLRSQEISTPNARAAASTTRMPSGTTSLPMPSPSITAILKPAICSSVDSDTPKRIRNDIVSITSGALLGFQGRSVLPKGRRKSQCALFIASTRNADASRMDLRNHRRVVRPSDHRLQLRRGLQQRHLSASHNGLTSVVASVTRSISCEWRSGAPFPVGSNAAAAALTGGATARSERAGEGGKSLRNNLLARDGNVSI